MTLIQQPEQQGHVPGETPVAPVDEQSLEQKEVAGLSQGQIVRRRFFRHKGAITCLVVLVLIVLLATTSIGWGPIPGWWQWDYDTVVPPNPNEHPTMSLRPEFLGGAGIQIGDHPFGLDNQNARDMFALTIRGVQQTLTVILVLAILAVSIGVIIGALSGFFGRGVDSVLMRFTDVILVIPLLLIAAVASFALDFSGTWSVILALGLFTWPGLARLVRAEFLALREREFVDAATRRRSVEPAHHLQAHPAQHGRHDHRGDDAADGGRHPRRGGPRLPRVRHHVTRRVARLAGEPVPGRVHQPPVAVHLAGRLHRGDRAVPAVHR